MEDKTERLIEVLRIAGETHGTVYKIFNGDDPDWASWYSDWLVNLSKLPEILGIRPVRSELTYLLVKLDKEYRDKNPQEKWFEYYARKIVDYFNKS